MSVTTRPKQTDEPVRLRAAELLAPDLLEWAGEGKLEQFIADLLKLRHWPRDGYEFAKALESQFYYSPDAGLVEILDGPYAPTRALDEAVQAWVIAEGVKPELAIGARVQFSRYGSGPKTGAISGIYEKDGRYSVIPDDEVEKFANGGGWLLPFEDVEIEQCP